eukprot:CAMPEP_0174298108 /NCGR_PEP_ID=MMETSP0809-20121228/52814_1 /TAXON_ID=73025 ORGANISM="Eutreptiella gymnastica-like, Strain CCMP1594" /NCGR_SAMPLE_ID=MMETSP0809 /ASSEMBLY_ACC=CAM_ASM_000658 /LENGTH=175 /DNA_ID=CAMNT_0015402331 /DNA_START=32 /DNA_END=559 /DNA_ORIENTATION=+
MDAVHIAECMDEIVSLPSSESCDMASTCSSFEFVADFMDSPSEGAVALSPAAALPEAPSRVRAEGGPSSRRRRSKKKKAASQRNAQAKLRQLLSAANGGNKQAAPGTETHADLVDELMDEIRKEARENGEPLHLSAADFFVLQRLMFGEEDGFEVDPCKVQRADSSTCAAARCIQ